MGCSDDQPLRRIPLHLKLRNQSHVLPIQQLHTGLVIFDVLVVNQLKQIPPKEDRTSIRLIPRSLLVQHPIIKISQPVAKLFPMIVLQLLQTQNVRPHQINLRHQPVVPMWPRQRHRVVPIVQIRVHLQQLLRQYIITHQRKLHIARIPPGCRRKCPPPANRLAHAQLAVVPPDQLIDGKLCLAERILRFRAGHSPERTPPRRTENRR